MKCSELKEAARTVFCWWACMGLLLATGAYLMIHCPQTTDAIGAWLGR